MVDPTPERLTVQQRVQRLLRIGLVVAATLILVGTGVAVLEGERTPTPVGLTSLWRDGTVPDRVAATGILLLALTPVVGVVTLIWSWWREGDRRFALIGVVVVSVLVAGVVLGHA